MRWECDSRREVRDVVGLVLERALRVDRKRDRPVDDVGNSVAAAGAVEDKDLDDPIGATVYLF